MTKKIFFGCFVTKMTELLKCEQTFEELCLQSISVGSQYSIFLNHP